MEAASSSWESFSYMWVRLCLLSLHSVIIHFMARKRRRLSVRGMGTWGDNTFRLCLIQKQEMWPSGVQQVWRETYRKDKFVSIYPQTDEATWTSSEMLPTNMKEVQLLWINLHIKELGLIFRVMLLSKSSNSNEKLCKSEKHWSASPDKIFHLSGCWPAQQQVYSSPEPGERLRRDNIQSLPFSLLELYGISPPVSSLCSPESKKWGIATISTVCCNIKQQISETVNILVKVSTFLLVSRCLWPESYFHLSLSCWWIYWKAKPVRRHE